MCAPSTAVLIRHGINATWGGRSAWMFCISILNTGLKLMGFYATKTHVQPLRQEVAAQWRGESIVWNSRLDWHSNNEHRRNGCCVFPLLCGAATSKCSSKDVDVFFFRVSVKVRLLFLRAYPLPLLWIAIFSHLIISYRGPCLINQRTVSSSVSSPIILLFITKAVIMSDTHPTHGWHHTCQYLMDFLLYTHHQHL